MANTLFSVSGNDFDGYRLYYGGVPVELAEVHIHWDGARPAHKVFGWHQRNKSKLYLPEKDRDGSLIHYNGNPREIKSSDDLRQFWWNGWKTYDIGDLFLPTIATMQTKKDIIKSARDHVLEQAREGKVYLETRFAPEFHTSNLNLDQVVGYSLEGLELGVSDARQHGYFIKPKSILCMFRQGPPKNGIKVAEIAKKYQHAGVVALDLACAEPGFSPWLFFDAFAETFDSDLKRTVHAGEMCKDEGDNLKNIEYSIRTLNAHGLGHAKDLYKRPDLMAEVREKGIRVESNEVSNEWLKFISKVGDARLDILDKSGIGVIIDSDDPVKWPDGSLAHCYLRAAIAYGDEFVKKVISNGAKHAFGLDERQKADLVSRLEGQFLH